MSLNKLYNFHNSYFKFTAPAEVHVPPHVHPTPDPEPTPEPTPDSSDNETEPEPEAKEQVYKRLLNKYKVRATRAKNRQPGKARKEGQVTKAVLLERLKQYLTPRAHQFVAEQAKLAGRKATGFRWSDEMKSLGLQLKNASPKAYKILQNVFRLPSIRTLNDILNKINIQPGFHPAVLRALQERAKSASQSQKLVSMAFDEMSLQENISHNKSTDQLEGFEDLETERSQYLANHSNVFMIRSITEDWKQPVGYFLTHSTMKSEVIKEKLVEGIRKVNQTGYIIKVVVLDQGANNQKAYRLLGVTPEKPYFEVDGRRIIALHDAPHLLKNVRNGLKKSGFVVDGEEVKWEHIVELYKIDSSKPIRMVPKLTAKHIQLPMFSTMSVPLASQVRLD